MHTDEQIEEMIAEAKPLPANFKSKLRLKEKRGHKERELDIEGMEGRTYKLILRQNTVNPIDFTIILAQHPKDAGKPFRLIRHNGKSHEHSNKIEETKFFDFHIHRATQRYQELGEREDSFAEVTDVYWDFNSAIDHMLESYGFRIAVDRGNLFAEDQDG